ncbi:flavodoxin family protein [Rhabdothermincola salaria]|uniref:flavodoxin family protein n=1 Tax=Rhabdothermincola salaria TaxID=2903142 RepID=UPI001E32FB86|nr:NAD(P)H-dependent oxidoreductase [Rhabdothermincola salaria]MCD9623301.1 NAD(P)H-dependent oxidoreductase [Rhabdothermincola salaria]
MSESEPLTAFGLNCSLKGTDAGPSSTHLLLTEVMEAFGGHGVHSLGIERVVDHDVRPGVTSDEGHGDEWPVLRDKVLAADILVLGTPIWLGHAASPAQRVLERLDAFLAEFDDRGRPVAFDKVAVVAVVGNEDGAHHVSAELFQGLNDVGFTIPAQGVTYWVGEAMHGTDYQDLPDGSEKTRTTTRTVAANGAHLARSLRGEGYPA